MKVFVVGAGQMGSGIAQVSAQAGYDTYMFDAVPAAMQKKYESNGFTSQEELTRAQQSLQTEQQALQELSERLQASFMEEQAKYNEEMRDSIQQFLKLYNKTKKYDFIMAKAGDNMLLANPKYDITNEVLKGLNKRYKIKPEVAEKIKKDDKKSDEKKK